MEWIDINEKIPDMLKINFFCDGDSIFLKGNPMQPFFVQISGEIKTFDKINFTHWMPMPVPPKLKDHIDEI